MNALQPHFSLVGRLLLALLFVPAGVMKITGFSGTVGYIASVGLPLALRTKSQTRTCGGISTNRCT